MNPDLDRTMPASLDAERAILGMVLLDNAVFPQAQILFADDFSLDKHRRIYGAMSSLAEAGRPIDLVTLTDELGKRKEIEAVDGIAYLCSLTEGLMSRSNIEHHVKIVRNKAMLRKTIHAANKTIVQAMEDSDNVEQIIASAQESLAKVAQQGITPKARDIFLAAHKFAHMAPENIQWLVEDVIQTGSNGMVIGRPKSGKSMMSLDLAVAMATGQRWLDFWVPNKTRVAFIAREDNPKLTSWRLRNLCLARGIEPPENLYINSREQTRTLMLDNETELQELISNLKRLRSQFLFLDVFRKLHKAEENDNTIMQGIMEKINRITDETGCAIALVHHRRSNTEGLTLTEGGRGASAIYGWAEWVIGAALADEAEQVRELHVELKADTPPPVVHFKIEHPAPPRTGMELKRILWQKPRRGKGKESQAAF